MHVARNLFVAGLVAAILGGPDLIGSVARADALTAPGDEVILTISGKIAETNQGEAAVFDLAMLGALPQHEFATSTIWTEGVATYKGVLLIDLLKAVGASGGTLSATALNDYQIDIPVAELSADAPLLAYMSNGAPMSVREKGPLWIIFPYDDVAEYRTEQTYARSIWQVDRLEVKD